MLFKIQCSKWMQLSFSTKRTLTHCSVFDQTMTFIKVSSYSCQLCFIFSKKNTQTNGLVLSDYLLIESRIDFLLDYTYCMVWLDLPYFWYQVLLSTLFSNANSTLHRRQQGRVLLNFNSTTLTDTAYKSVVFLRERNKNKLRIELWVVNIRIICTVYKSFFFSSNNSIVWSKPLLQIIMW